MSIQIRTFLIALSLVATATGCALMDDEPVGSTDTSPSDAVVQQHVFLQPVFVLDGIEELPSGLVLDELHLGVGAIFLDLLDEDDGVAFANRNPFKLHFDVRDGQLGVVAPDMTLPAGGSYQISVQLEPLARLAEGETVTSGTRLESVGGEASLVVRGRIVKSTYPLPNADEGDEPAPLPWMPIDPDDMRGLQRDVSVVPFTYASDRTVRFIIDDVELVAGTRNELIMRLAVGDWVRESIRPALNNALGEVSEDDSTSERVEAIGLEFSERLDAEGAGMDRLIGGINVEVRQEGR